MGIHPDLIQRISRLESLEDENRRLKERNAALEAELVQLREGREGIGVAMQQALEAEKGS
jgi:cell division septum initiation protein DivIVA